MATPAEVMERLNALADGLGQTSSALNDMQTELIPMQARIDQHVADYEIGLWHKHVNEGDKLPAEKLRERMAIRDLDPVLYGRYSALVGKRKQYQQRISDLKAEIDAERSILSALKEEMAATR